MNPIFEFLSTGNTNSGLNEFYHPQSGLTFDETMCMPHDQFEARHDVIQWIFPTMTQSKAQPTSPYIRHSDMIDTNGINLGDIKESVRRAKNYYASFLSDNTDLWLVPYNHNHLRITRAIESISLFCSRREADVFLRYVTHLCSQNAFPISFTSYEYWQNAPEYGTSMQRRYGFFTVGG